MARTSFFCVFFFFLLIPPLRHYDRVLILESATTLYRDIRQIIPLVYRTWLCKRWIFFRPPTISDLFCDPSLETVWSDMEFVQNFTLPDFQAKNFTPSISPNFNSFSKKKHNEWKWRNLHRWQNFTLPPGVTGVTNSNSGHSSHCSWCIVHCWSSSFLT